MEGTIPVAAAQDSAGPIAKTVQDVAYILNAIVNPTNSSSPIDYLQSCVSTNLDGLRIGVPTASFPSSDQAVLGDFGAALLIMGSAGASIIENTNFQGTEEFNKMSADEKLYAMAGSFKHDIGLYAGTLTKNPHNISSLQDIMYLAKTDSAEDYPTRAMEAWDLAASIDLDGQQYKSSLDKNKYFSGEGGILGALDRYNLDLIAAPAMFGPAVSFAARGGLPLVVLPIGKYPKGTEVKMYSNGPFTTIDIGPNVP
jgi:amidase